jgi:hypothetical protein
MITGCTRGIETASTVTLRVLDSVLTEALESVLATEAAVAPLDKLMVATTLMLAEDTASSICSRLTPAKFASFNVKEA